MRSKANLSFTRYSFPLSNLRLFFQNFYFMILFILFCPNLFAIDSRVFSAFFSPSEVSNNEELQSLHYNALKYRFVNNNFDDILFSGNEAESPRLTIENHKLMIQAISRFLATTNNSENFLLREQPNFPAFSLNPHDKELKIEELKISQNGFAEWQDQVRRSFFKNQFLTLLSASSQYELVRLVAKKFPQVKSIFDLHARKLLLNKELFETTLRMYSTISKIDKSSELISSAAILTFGYWLLENHLTNTVEFSSLNVWEKLYLQLPFISEIAKIIKNFQMPGKLGNNFLSYAGYKQVLSSPFPKSHIVVVPMSRWAAMFKGIGPGECIRSSANRFFDAFYPFSMAFSIMVDGKELGYIGIYKVFEKSGTLPIWYIDTLQTPGLVTDSGYHQILDAILGQLERYALSEGSVLGIGDSDWNGTNYKENIPSLETRGILKTIEVAFTSSPRLTAIFDFVKSKKQSHHQELMSKSGYKSESNMMYDTLLRNSYKVRVLEPSSTLTDAELDQYVYILGLDSSYNYIDNALLKKMSRLSSFGLSPHIKLRLYKLYQENTLAILNNHDLKSEIYKIIFPILSENGKVSPYKNLKKANFSNLSHDELIEVLMLVDTEEEFLKVLSQIKKKSNILNTIAAEFIIPLFRMRNYQNWISAFSAVLRIVNNDFSDVRIAYEFSQFVITITDFEKFSRVCFGTYSNDSIVNDTEIFSRIYASLFFKILNSVEGFENQLRFARKTIQMAKDDLIDDLKLRTIQGLTHYEEILSFEGLNSLINDFVSDQNIKSFLSLRIFKQSIMRFTSKEVIEIYELLLENTNNDSDDLLVAESVKNYIANDDFSEWLKISYGQKNSTHMADDNIRQKFFSDEISRRAQEANTKDSQHLILMGSNFFKINISAILNKSNDINLINMLLAAKIMKSILLKSESDELSSDFDSAYKRINTDDLQYFKVAQVYLYHFPVMAIKSIQKFGLEMALKLKVPPADLFELLNSSKLTSEQKAFVFQWIQFTPETNSFIQQNFNSSFFKRSISQFRLSNETKSGYRTYLNMLQDTAIKNINLPRLINCRALLTANLILKK